MLTVLIFINFLFPVSQFHYLDLSLEVFNRNSNDKVQVAALMLVIYQTPLEPF